MRIGIVSDTHGDSYAIRRVIEQAGRVDAWIHLGDNTRDAEAFGKDGTPVYSVAGNCDFGGEKELRISLDGAEIFAAHGHYYGVTAGTDRLAYRAEELGCNVALYGLCIEPYYDAAATATMMLDRLMQGEDTAKKVTVNRPIAYGDTIDKYKAIYNEVKELFDVE